MAEMLTAIVGNSRTAWPVMEPSGPQWLEVVLTVISEEAENT
jgi:hypothetical protein